MSGLKVNYEKTEALWIGTSKSSNLTFPSSKPITWANEKVFTLGMWFSTLEDRSLNSNFIEKIEKIRSILDNWSARRLTLLGKITIIKTLAVSQIVYILSSLPTPPDILETFNSILCDFLWDAHYKKGHATAYHDPTLKDPVDTLLSHTKVSKKIYECLINKKASIPSRNKRIQVGFLTSSDDFIWISVKRIFVSKGWTKALRPSIKDDFALLVLTKKHNRPFCGLSGMFHREWRLRCGGLYASLRLEDKRLGSSACWNTEHQVQQAIDWETAIGNVVAHGRFS
ncbi:unnamed protein product [Porites evermanni]|uniref:Uncharacterized protein n=1 Tax=Porites evermanni TaxID=104178 RepID=A0ABN8SZA1_9CNID|nr:unnamed protein product [Porites evermanni]